MVTVFRTAKQLSFACVVLILSSSLLAQLQPINQRPNPFSTTDNWAILPDGRSWGSTAGVDMDPDRRHLWAIDRCGANSCIGSSVNPIVKIDPTGKVVASIGGGLFSFPHGLHVDRDGNIWVTDARGPQAGNPATAGKGHSVYKLSPEGEVLLILGQPGVAGDGTDALLATPCDVVTDADGNIYVGDGHEGQFDDADADTVARIVKFDRDGKLLSYWGGWGTTAGKLKTPHALDIDSRNRLVVGDRGNNRLQIFDLEGNYIAEFRSFSRPSGIYITADDTIYVADSESQFDGTTDSGWRPGIRVGSLLDGIVDYFIDGTVADYPQGSNPEGVAVDSAGNVYSAVVSEGGSC
jgi:DNA-binding beta-propeller fold protein YncE